MLGSKRTRAIVLGTALLATVVATVWPRAQEKSVPEVVTPVVPRTMVAGEVDVSSIASRPPSLPSRAEQLQTAPEVHDLFGAKSWEPPPAPVKYKPAPPPKPTAPPFPYVVSGRIDDNDAILVVFTGQQQSFIVRVGEVLEHTYRVDAVDAQAVTLTYLPLGLTQRVPLAALN
jgi:hypothetical protein